MKPETFNYLYKYDNGAEKKRDEVLKDILNFVGKGKYPMKEIAKGIGLNYQSTTSAVRFAVRNDIMFSQRVGRKYEFGAGYVEEDSCLLAEIFYNKEKILSNFKIKGTQKRKVEDAPNVSIIANKTGIVYTQHVLNTVYD